jgi:hypothetical protein
MKLGGSTLAWKTGEREEMEMASKSAYATPSTEESANVEAPAAASKTANRVAERVTVNLSRKSAEALEHAAALSDDTKTEVINKALQLYDLVRTAQENKGAVWIQDGEDGEPARVRFY